MTIENKKIYYKENLCKDNNICNNCGKYGHIFSQCNLPIISYGIILFRKILNKTTQKNETQYLMIRRKDSFGYIDFIRGKYVLHNKLQIQNIFNEMTIIEKNNIINYDFNHLWNLMWYDCSLKNKYINQEIASAKKFDMIKNGLVNDNEESICLTDLINNSTTNWSESEWEFPKGRRNNSEKILDCAMREFEEETGISTNDITLINNVSAFEEIFIGSNLNAYKHKYFLAYYSSNNTIDNMNNYQKSEVSKIEWKTLNECLESIRPYNLEKKKIITNIDNIINKYIFINE
jgi:ADP-ribose pyrophosphatase YjhB (NUDIX family)